MFQPVAVVGLDGKRRVRKGRITPKRIEIAERDSAALKLRREGKGVAEIAAKLGFPSISAAHGAIRRGFNTLREEPAEDNRLLDLARVDFIIEILTPQVKKGNLGAMDRYFRAIDYRAKVLGLYAPAKESEDPRERLAKLLGCTMDQLPDKTGQLLKITATKVEMSYGPAPASVDAASPPPVALPGPEYEIVEDAVEVPPGE